MTWTRIFIGLFAGAMLFLTQAAPAQVTWPNGTTGDKFTYQCMGK